MPEKTHKTTIRLLGNDYTIAGDDSEEYMQRVAFFVDKKFNEIHERNTHLSTNMIAVLASMNIADERFRLEENCDSLRKQIAVYAEQSDQDQEQIAELNRKNEMLNQEIQRLKIEIAKLEVKKR